MKNNFTQALKELTGFDGEPNQVETTTQKQSNVEVPSLDFGTNSQDEVVSFEEVVSDTSSESTLITGTMVIKGDIKSKDNILVNGEVLGEIETTENLTSSGLIIGNVSARNMLMKNARIKGNIGLDGNLVVGEGSVIAGNIDCENFDVAGKIKGNCSVKSFAKMQSSAYLAGDIVADDIQTEQGAKIIGTITTRTEDLDIESIFDFGGEF